MMGSTCVVCRCAHILLHPVSIGRSIVLWCYKSGAHASQWAPLDTYLTGKGQVVSNRSFMRAHSYTHIFDAKRFHCSFDFTNFVANAAQLGMVKSSMENGVISFKRFLTSVELLVPLP